MLVQCALVIALFFRGFPTYIFSPSPVVCCDISVWCRIATRLPTGRWGLLSQVKRRYLPPVFRFFLPRYAKTALPGSCTRSLYELSRCVIAEYGRFSLSSIIVHDKHFL